MTVACRRVAGAADVLNPGDFAFYTATPGRAARHPTRDNETPTHLWLMVPGGHKAAVPIAGPGDTSQPQAWGWDGDFERPTLTPSLDISDGTDRWHGWLTDGELVDA